MTRYFLSFDANGEKFLIPVEKGNEWNAWVDCLAADEFVEDCKIPAYVTRVNGQLTFTDPRVVYDPLR